MLIKDGSVKEFFLFELQYTVMENMRPYSQTSLIQITVWDLTGNSFTRFEPQFPNL